jgi:2-polyprenyl-3-methyl-5-hydroxy-6-metoxy-1,4-benzoquinol methylase
MARDAGYDVHAIDRDEHAAAFLRDEIGVDVTLSDQPAEAVRGLGSFNVIAMWHCIEHVPKPLELLTACAQALLPGGFLFVAAPNPMSLQFRIFGKRWSHVDAPRHLTLMSESTLSEQARRHSLERVFFTTTDPLGLSLNAFGWAESLRTLAPNRLAGWVIVRAGYAGARLLRRVEAHLSSGSAFTVVYRKSRRMNLS